MNPLEQQLAQFASQPHAFGSDDLEPARLAENLHSIHAELGAPRESRLARALRRVGVPDLSVPLVTATPALRRSWFIAVTLAVLLALSVASNDTSPGVERIVLFLTLAPLVPLLGVALAFGKGVDPTHDLVVAAPRDTFTVFLVRAVTVLTASSGILLLSSLLLPEGGIYRVAWLFPALALSLLTMALSTKVEPRRAAVIVGVSWIVLVFIGATATGAAQVFGGFTQVLSVVIAVVAGWFVVHAREQFDQAEAV